jgi:hypothetical protein
LKEQWCTENTTAGLPCDDPDLFPPSVCPDNDFIPNDLIDFYFKGGTTTENLQCPIGTISAQTSFCIGHCKIPITNLKQTFKVNPVNYSWSVDGETNLAGENRVQHIDKPL